MVPRASNGSKNPRRRRRVVDEVDTEDDDDDEDGGEEGVRSSRDDEARRTTRGDETTTTRRRRDDDDDDEGTRDSTRSWSRRRAGASMQTSSCMHARIRIECIRWRFCRIISNLNAFEFLKFEWRAREDARAS